MEAKSIVIGVEGMTCGSCVQTIEEHVGKMSGVHRVNVSNAIAVSYKASFLYEKPW